MILEAGQLAILEQHLSGAEDQVPSIRKEPLNPGTGGRSTTSPVVEDASFMIRAARSSRRTGR
ncbi:MAG: hypothetical protein ACR2L4_01005 [Actinomycetota bacterium]